MDLGLAQVLPDIMMYMMVFVRPATRRQLESVCLTLIDHVGISPILVKILVYL